MAILGPLVGEHLGAAGLVLQLDHDISHPLRVGSLANAVARKLDELADLLPRVIVLKIGLNGLELLLLIGAVVGHAGFALDLARGLKLLQVDLGLLEDLSLLRGLFVLALFERDLPLVVPDGHGSGPGGLNGSCLRDDILDGLGPSVLGAGGPLKSTGKLYPLGPGAIPEVFIALELRCGISPQSPRSTKQDVVASTCRSTES